MTLKIHIGCSFDIKKGWERIQNYCQINNLKTLYIPITTVFKYDEYSSLQIGS